MLIAQESKMIFPTSPPPAPLLPGWMVKGDAQKFSLTLLQWLALMSRWSGSPSEAYQGETFVDISMQCSVWFESVWLQTALSPFWPGPVWSGATGFLMQMHQSLCTICHGSVTVSTYLGNAKVISRPAHISASTEFLYMYILYVYIMYIWTVNAIFTCTVHTCTVQSIHAHTRTGSFNADLKSCLACNASEPTKFSGQ